MKININTVLIITGIMFLYFCGRGGHNTTNDHLLAVDTVRLQDTTHYQIVEHIVHHHDTVRIDRAEHKDSSELAQDYYTEREYEDSVRDTNIVGVWRARVWKNILIDPRFDYQILRPQLIITKTVADDPRNKLFFGLYGNAVLPPNKFEFTGGVKVDLLDKRERMTSIGYDPFQQSIMIGYSAKIRFGAGR